MVTRIIERRGRDTVQVIEVERIALDERQAGGTVNRYDVVFLDGEFVRQAQADALTTIPARGMAYATSAASGIRLDVLIRGVVSNSDWNFASNDVLFLSPLSAGLMTNTSPSNSGEYVQRVGRSLTPTTMQFQPEDNYFRITT